MAGLNPDDLKLYWLNEQPGDWEIVPGQSTDGGGTLTAPLSHFSIYATATSTFISGPPNLFWHQTDEHAGAATYSIPIEVPAGPGGFSIPPLAFEYNSSRVDEMKSANSVGSWAGVGWDVSIPSIRRDPTTGYYYLEINGASDRLISTGTDGTATKWSTATEINYKIRSKTASNGQHNVWTVTTPDGTEYRFGTQTDLNSPSTSFARWYWTWTGSAWQQDYYRIDLARIVDMHDNYADYSYAQGPSSYCPSGATSPACQTNIVFAYVDDVKWGGNLGTSSGHKFQVDFAVTPRTDHTAGCTPAPLAYEYARLTDIYVKVLTGTSTWNVAKRYNILFDTAQQSTASCPNAGVRKPTSIKFIGTDNNTSNPLRTMTFTYANEAIDYKHDLTTCVTFTRPYLATVTNGFGATTTLTTSTSGLLAWPAPTPRAAAQPTSALGRGT